MKIEIPLFGRKFPLEIADDKVPGLMDTLLDKILPNASKHMESLRAMDSAIYCAMANLYHLS